VNWNNNDIPGWGQFTPFPAVLDRMRDAGYQATEYDRSFGMDAGVLRAEADQRGMIWTGSYQWLDFLDTDRLDEAVSDLMPTLELLETIGCQNLIVADSLRPHRLALAGRVPSDGSQSLDDPAVRRLARGVHKLAETANGYNIAVHYHNHVGSWIEAPHELEALLAYLDTSLVDLCFDTGHFAYGGGDPARFITEHHDAIGYLHLKDVDTSTVEDARKRQLSFIDALREYVFSPIGMGSADIPAILEVLVSSSFNGWIVVEQDTCEGDPTTTARDNLRFITTWLSGHADTLATGR
jgi:inosose dehydratase